LIRYP